MLLVRRGPLARMRRLAAAAAAVAVAVLAIASMTAAVATMGMGACYTSVWSTLPQEFPDKTFEVGVGIQLRVRALFAPECGLAVGERWRP